MNLLKSFSGEVKIKEDLNTFYKQNGMFGEDSFKRTFVAHKTIDYLYKKGLLKEQPNEQ